MWTPLSRDEQLMQQRHRLQPIQSNQLREDEARQYQYPPKPLPRQPRRVEVQYVDMQSHLSAIQSLEEQLDELHGFLARKGYNTRGTQDFSTGAAFDLPVDASHKATYLRIGSVAQPHMMAFHLSWWGFFATFFSTFSPAPLLPYIIDSLKLTKEETAAAAMSTASAAVVFRLLMGFACDRIGPRRSMCLILLLTTPPLIAMMFVQTATGFIICRCLIGIGLASFVASQSWVSLMFSSNIVGLAKSTVGGWGNLGGGVVNLIMPFIFLSMRTLFHGDEDRAWRACFFFPAVLHLSLAAISLGGRDLPDGNVTAALEFSGTKPRIGSTAKTQLAYTNVNTWLLFCLYGACFGVELTITNGAVLYFHEYHDLSIPLSGALASTFGAMNLFARSLGGLISDWLAADCGFGVRGRIACLLATLVLEGCFCVGLGLTTSSIPVDSIPASTTAALCVVWLCVFSVFVQMAEGACFALVPLVNPNAGGAISGIVGAGGNLGSVLLVFLYFSSSDSRTDEQFVKLGYAIAASSILCTFLYFPSEGGLFVRAHALGKYDPQLFRPKASLFLRVESKLATSRLNLLRQSSSSKSLNTSISQSLNDGVRKDIDSSRNNSRNNSRNSSRTRELNWTGGTESGVENDDLHDILSSGVLLEEACDGEKGESLRKMQQACQQALQHVCQQSFQQAGKQAARTSNSVSRASDAVVMSSEQSQITTRIVSTALPASAPANSAAAEAAVAAAASAASAAATATSAAVTAAAAAAAAVAPSAVIGSAITPRVRSNGVPSAEQCAFVRKPAELKKSAAAHHNMGYKHAATATATATATAMATEAEFESAAMDGALVPMETTLVLNPEEQLASKVALVTETIADLPKNDEVQSVGDRWSQMDWRFLSPVQLQELEKRLAGISLESIAELRKIDYVREAFPTFSTNAIRQLLCEAGGDVALCCQRLCRAAENGKVKTKRQTRYPEML